MLRFYLSFLCSLCLLAQVAQAAWDTNIWDAQSYMSANTNWIIRDHHIEIHGGVNERTLAATGSAWSEAQTDPHWITLDLWEDVIDQLEVLCPQYIDPDWADVSDTLAPWFNAHPVSAAASNATSIAVSGLVASNMVASNTTFVIQGADDWGTPDTTYTTTTHKAASGAGTATLTFAPGLDRAVTTNDVLVFTTAPRFVWTNLVNRVTGTDHFFWCNSDGVATGSYEDIPVPMTDTWAGVVWSATNVGTVLEVDGLTTNGVDIVNGYSIPKGMRFTIAGVTGTYATTEAALVTLDGGWPSSWATLMNITPALAATPDDDAVITWLSIDESKPGWIKREQWTTLDEFQEVLNLFVWTWEDAAISGKLGTNKTASGSDTGEDFTFTYSYRYVIDYHGGDPDEIYECGTSNLWTTNTPSALTDYTTPGVFSTTNVNVTNEGVQTRFVQDSLREENLIYSMITYAEYDYTSDSDYYNFAGGHWQEVLALLNSAKSLQIVGGNIGAAGLVTNYAAEIDPYMFRSMLYAKAITHTDDINVNDILATNTCTPTLFDDCFAAGSWVCGESSGSAYGGSGQTIYDECEVYEDDADTNELVVVSSNVTGFINWTVTNLTTASKAVGASAGSAWYVPPSPDTNLYEATTNYSDSCSGSGGGDDGFRTLVGTDYHTQTNTYRYLQAAWGWGANTGGAAVRWDVANGFNYVP